MSIRRYVFEIATALLNEKLTCLAGQTLQRPEEQYTVIELLERNLNACKFPPKALIDDLRKVWKESTSSPG